MSTKIGRSIFLPAVLLTLLMLSTTAAMAEDIGNGCKLQGTWIGEWDQTGLKYFITFIGTGAPEGTINQEWIGDAGASNARGVWVKTGPNTFDYSVTLFFTEGPFITIVGKRNGTITLLDCNTYEWTGVMDVWTPGGTEPEYSFTGTGSAQRMRLEQPYEP